MYIQVLYKPQGLAYTYIATRPVEVGEKIKVPVGKENRPKSAIVSRINVEKPDFPCKEICDIDEVSKETNDGKDSVNEKHESVDQG